MSSFSMVVKPCICVKSPIKGCAVPILVAIRFTPHPLHPPPIKGLAAPIPAAVGRHPSPARPRTGSQPSAHMRVMLHSSERSGSRLLGSTPPKCCSLMLSLSGGA